MKSLYILRGSILTCTFLTKEENDTETLVKSDRRHSGDGLAKWNFTTKTALNKKWLI